MGRAERALLVLIVLLAAGLRGYGLDAGLRHTPHMDERYFVENVWQMIEQRDLDHRYYEYPGLFFYLLAPALALVKTPGPPGAQAYVVARGVVAAFGVANILLLHRLGRRIAGPRAALVAALFLALSPVDVQTSHMVRADVVLESVVLLALVAFQGVDERGGGDLRAGALTGAAVAVKFTGALLVPSYLVRRWLAPGPRLRGAAIAAGAALGAFALASPYALLHARAFLEGATTQVAYHYQEQPHGATPPLLMLLEYAAVWPKALGWPGILLLLVGLSQARRHGRTWLPLLVLPLVTLAAFATQEYRFDRHIVPSFGVLALLAGLGAARIADYHAGLAVAAALASAAVPATRTVAYLRSLSQPGAKDAAVEWITSHVPPGARIVSTVEGLGLDPGRFEVLALPRLRERSRLQVLNADVVVSARPGDEAVLRELPLAFVARPETAAAGRPLRIRLIPTEARPRYVPVALDRARFKASQNVEALPALHDGRLDTRWEAPARPEGGEWIRVDLDTVETLGRIELSLGGRPDGAGHGLQLGLSADGLHWTRLQPLSGRPGDHQVGSPSQVLLFPPTRARIVRIIQTGRGTRPWAVAELRLDAVSPAGPRSE
jgi:hypothetical protein